MLRCKEAKGILLQVSEETREADMRLIVEGGKFLFLRDVCCKMNRGKWEVEDSGHEADDDDTDTDSRNPKRSRLSDLVMETESLNTGQYLGMLGMPEDLQAQMGGRPGFSEPWTPERNRVKGRQVWEWTGYDSEAEHWLYEQANRVEATDGVVEMGHSESDKVWEWTQYEEEAEREEAKRKGRRRLRDLNLDLDLDLQSVGHECIASKFGGMSLSNIDEP